MLPEQVNGGDDADDREGGDGEREHHEAADEEHRLEVGEQPHLSDERVVQVKLALEPDDREEGATLDVLEQVDVLHLFDQNVDLKPGLDADRDSGLRLDDENRFVLLGFRFDRSGLDLRTSWLNEKNLLQSKTLVS